MQIIYKDLDSLREYENNNRKHSKQQVARIAASIKEYGFSNPIIVDKDGCIIAGHGRYQAAQELKLETVPTIALEELTEQQVKELRILDNELAAQANRDFTAIDTELRELESEGFDLEEWGLSRLKITVNSDEDNFTTSSELETSIKQGDLITLGCHRLICGDSTDEATVSAVLNGVKPAVMVTDPPYGVNYDPGWRISAGMCQNTKKQGRVLNDDRADWAEAYRLSNAQVAYVWHDSLSTDIVKTGLEVAGYKAISLIVWNKERFTISRGDYHWKHETAWYAAKSKHNWQGATD